MPLQIDVSAVAQPASSTVDPTIPVEVLIEAQADQAVSAYQLLAARRAQLEDAETLRRVRAL